jgi:tRNA threonylcarbamoyladenosine biosynthesis protein TsaB
VNFAVRILALESSIQPGSVAVLATDVVLQTAELPRNLRTTQSLAPAIRAQVTQAGWHPRELQLIAVSQGPGSFTGLRIGITTAKTLAYAVGAELLGIDTLDAIAAQAEPRERPLWVVMDAHRQQFFCARYRWSEGRWQAATGVRVVDIASWLAALTPGESVTGPGLDRVAGRLPPEVLVEAAERWAPTAATIGKLAWSAYQSGRRDDVWKLAPRYGRPSAAEEKAS